MESVVLITGGAKRLGAAMAKRLHKEGAKVIVHCHSSRTEAQQLVDNFNRQRQDSAAVIQGPLAGGKTSAEILAGEALNCFGRVSHLINNASAFYPTPIGSIDDDDWQQLVGSNMQGPLYLTQAIAASIKEHKGSILNMVDIHVYRPLVGHTLYCMAKAALMNMTLSLAKELAPDVRVNAIAPGAILWPEGSLSKDEKSSILAQIPLQRLGTPEDIADAASFLLNADYVTGQVLSIDGGRSLGGNEKA